MAGKEAANVGLAGATTTPSRPSVTLSLEPSIRINRQRGAIYRIVYSVVIDHHILYLNRIRPKVGDERTAGRA
ncbi:MAG: hypothetical protein GY731_15055 [Gammaproteobacteria bacterium]|nr:hypothetical protein [Gammaproteobacteria bacterium]